MKLTKIVLLIAFATAQQTGNGIEIGFVDTIKQIKICFKREFTW